MTIFWSRHEGKPPTPLHGEARYCTTLSALFCTVGSLTRRPVSRNTYRVAADTTIWPDEQYPILLFPVLALLVWIISNFKQLNGNSACGPWRPRCPQSPNFQRLLLLEWCLIPEKGSSNVVVGFWRWSQIYAYIRAHGQCMIIVKHCNDQDNLCFATLFQRIVQRAAIHGARHLT